MELSRLFKVLEQRSNVSEEPLSVSEARDGGVRFGDEDRADEVEGEVDQVGER